MIRATGLFALGVLAWGSLALAQDAPPPGCRWQGQTLACKDGKGHWRRAGDDEIVGAYPLGDLRPKPKPAAKVIPAPPPPVVAAPVVAAPLAETPPPAPEAVAAEPTAAPAASVEPAQPVAAPPAPPPAPVAEPPPQPKPWWRRWLDDIWRDIQAFLRMIGLAH